MRQKDLMTRPKLHIMFGSMGGPSDCTVILLVMHGEDTQVVFKTAN